MDDPAAVLFYAGIMFLFMLLISIFSLAVERIKPLSKTADKIFNKIMLNDKEDNEEDT